MSLRYAHEQAEFDKKWYYRWLDKCFLLADDRNNAYWPWQKWQRRYFNLKLSRAKYKKDLALRRVRRHLPHWPH